MILGARTVPRDERWMVADENLAEYLRRPITPARRRRLDSERSTGSRLSDIQLARERIYDRETDRLLRDLRFVTSERETA